MVKVSVLSKIPPGPYLCCLWSNSHWLLVIRHIKMVNFRTNTTNISLIYIVSVSDLNMCESNPCLNGGTCSVAFWYGARFQQEYGYKCSCPVEYVGFHCERDGKIIVNTVALFYIEFGYISSGVFRNYLTG